MASFPNYQRGRALKVNMKDREIDAYAAEDLMDIPMERVENGEASLPNPEEIRAGIPPHRGTSKSSWKVFAWILIGTIILLSVVIGLAVGLTTNTNESNVIAGTSSDTTIVDDTGDEVPAENVPRNAKFNDIVDYFSRQNVSMQVDFDNESSPQSKAARWLAEEDRLNLETPNGNIFSDEGYDYLQRYVLALDYYALDGPNWRHQFNFLTGSHFCSWGGFQVTSSGIIPVGVGCSGTASDHFITTIFLDWNLLNGTFPTENGLLRTLEALDLHLNEFVGGQIATELCGLTSLEYLSAGYTGLSGAIPPCIGQLSNLEVLFLSNTLLEGEVPQELSQLSLLEKIFLDDNKLRGNVSTMFNNMLNIVDIFLEDNEFTGEIGAEFIAGGSGLTRLDLSNNNITGEIPTHFFEYANLTVLDLHGNDITGSLPEPIPTNEKLEILALHQNILSGSIPPSISNLRVLLHLDLASNVIDGEIPSELGMITSLRYLFLADNRNLVNGPIPQTFANLTNLEELSLKSTRRTGELPDFISEFENLLLLDLDDNDFSGQLPSNYSMLDKLQFFLVNRNSRLSGFIPSEYDNLSSLRSVFLDTTNLTGDFEPLCKIANLNEPNDTDLDGKELVAADCGGDNPKVECKCCDICCKGQNCHDNNHVASLDLIWERRFQRFEFTIGNSTKYPDRDLAP